MAKKILITSSECFPYQKAGGLGDANADYSFAYKKYFPKDEISVILPLYNMKSIKPAVEISGYQLKQDISFDYTYGINKGHCIVYKTIKPYNDIPAIFLYSDDFSIYEKIYDGDIFRNSCSFSFAVLEYLKKLKNDERPDILQTTDFPVFKSQIGENPEINTKIVHIIHNGATPYQSVTNAMQTIFCLGSKKLIDKYFDDIEVINVMNNLYEKLTTKKSDIETVAKYISINCTSILKKEENIKEIAFLSKKAALILDDLVNENCIFNPIKYNVETCDFWLTDSPSYYEDILRDIKYTGEQLYYSLKKTENKSGAVLAGVDPKRYDPNNSKNIFVNYNLDNFEKMRRENRKYLFENLTKEKIKNYNKLLFSDPLYKTEGYLKEIDNSILIFMSARADIFQKGIDVAFSAIDEVIQNENIQFIFSSPNSFNINYIQKFISYVKNNPLYEGRYVFIDSYIPNEMYCAGADLFLMPSRFEPCGFSQLIAMRFGCIPVVTKTGGLNDTVFDYNSNKNKGNGFKSDYGIIECNTSSDYVNTLKRAVDTIKNKEVKNKIIRNAMNYDSSWNKEKVEGYHKIYNKVCP